MTTATRTPNDATTTRPQRSSRRVAHRTPLGWLPWALLGLLALLLAVCFLLVNALDDDGTAGPAGDSLGQAGGSAAAAPGAEGPAAGTAADGTSTDGTGADGTGADGTGSAALTADGQDLLAAAGSSLAGRVGQQVQGAATVESVVSDEGFWVGSPQSRVFVYLTPEARRSQGESGFQVTAGQTVRLGGSLAALGESPEAADGVTAPEGLGELQQQQAYVRADAVELA